MSVHNLSYNASNVDGLRTTYHLFVIYTDCLGHKDNEWELRFDQIEDALLRVCDKCRGLKLFGGEGIASRIDFVIYRRRVGWFEKIRNPWNLRDNKVRKTDVPIMAGGAGFEVHRYV